MDKKLKIAVVTSSLSAGGAERVISQLVNEWSQLGCEIFLVLLDKSERFYVVPDSIKIYEVGEQSKNRIVNKLKKYRYVKKIIQRINPHIVLSMPEEIGIYVLWALRHMKTPVVVSERNNPWIMPNKKITRYMRKLMYPHAAGLIFQTERAASFFSKKIRNKSVVLPNPLELSRLPEVFWGERDRVIVGVGRLEPQKNFPLLIEAFSIFYGSHPDYKLKIYGDGGQRHNLEELIVVKGLQGAVMLPGVSDTLLEDIRKASMFVLSSDYEGVPNILIEAIAIGIPCISTDCEPGGAASIIDNNINGILVPIKDVEKLVEAMEYLVTHSFIAEEFSAGAVDIRKKYDSRNVSLQWLKYLESKAQNNKN